jgi:two-component system, NtrC family, nitrogen regulation sensor histidine kinase NtrY
VLDSLGSNEAAVAPIRRYGKDLIGFIIADRWPGRRPIDDHDLSSLQVLVTQVAGVVSSLRHAAEETQGRIKAARSLAAHAVHMVGNRLDNVGDLLLLLQITFSGRPGMEEIATEVLPKAMQAVEDGKLFLREFRDFTTYRPLELRRTVLKELVDAAVRESGRPQGGTEVIWDGDVPPVECDPHYLKHCFIELVTNALAAGATHLQIAARYLPEVESVEVTVDDDGEGLSPSIGDRVFEPLFTTRKSGSGLGLSLVREIIERHGGTIQVVTSRKRGVRFVIGLPVRGGKDFEDERTCVDR